MFLFTSCISGLFIRCLSRFFTPSLTPCSPLSHVTPDIFLIVRSCQSILRVVFRCQHVYVYVIHLRVSCRCPSASRALALPPCSPLPHVAPIFVSAPACQPVFHSPHSSHTTFISTTASPFICSSFSLLAALAVCCDRDVSLALSSTPVHAHLCSGPGEGEGFWGVPACMPVCRRSATGYSRSFSPYAGYHCLLRFSSGLSGCMHFSRVGC